jgi:hypothetical protein
MPLTPELQAQVHAHCLQQVSRVRCERERRSLLVRSPAPLAREKEFVGSFARSARAREGGCCFVRPLCSHKRRGCWFVRPLFFSAPLAQEKLWCVPLLALANPFIATVDDADPAGALGRATPAADGGGSASAAAGRARRTGPRQRSRLRGRRNGDDGVRALLSFNLRPPLTSLARAGTRAR